MNRITGATKDALMMVVDFILIGYCGAVLILAITMGYLHYQDSLNRPVVQYPRYEEPSSEQLSAAHKFHGIFSSIYNPKTGESYFYRDDKKCPLFGYLNN